MEELLFCTFYEPLTLRGDDLERTVIRTFDTFGQREWLDEFMPTRWELKITPGSFDEPPHPMHIGLRPVHVFIVFDTMADRLLYKLRWDV